MLLVILALGDLRAQESTAIPGQPVTRRTGIDLTRGVLFEVTPHTGVMGTSGVFGLRLGMNYGSLALELAGEQVIGETANLYPISFNLLLNLSTYGRLIPYGVVGGGLWLTVPTNALGAETVSSLGLNFGGGARYYLTRSFGVRLEGKMYMTNVSNEREPQSELLFYQEVSLGVSFLFR